MNERRSLDTICAALCYAMGIEAPACAAAPSPELCAYVDQKLGGRKADRILMYNPDAVAQWVQEKYPQLMKEVPARTEIALPLTSVMPSVTPVCFGTMYTGAQPEVHGIRKYEKPVIKIDTIFDALIRNGKRAAIIGDTSCSMGKIYLEREMDYFLYIMSDEYDFIAVYNGNYDSLMHKHGPESIEALGELRSNSHAFGELSELVKRHWQHHNTLVGFAMDHGCHEIDGSCGSHGLDMDEDLHIQHHYMVYPAK